MFCYWQFVAFAIARSLYDTSDATSAGFRQAVLVNGQIGGFYNFIAFIAAFAMVPIARKMGARPVHAISVAASGIAMLALPWCSTEAMLFIPMIGIGLGWASMMGNPYVILANSIPPARTGIYMGIFNMFIVIPMLIERFPPDRHAEARWMSCGVMHTDAVFLPAIRSNSRSTMSAAPRSTSCRIVVSGGLVWAATITSS